MPSSGSEGGPRPRRLGELPASAGPHRPNDVPISNTVLQTLDLDAPLRGELGFDWPGEPITDLRWVALHMIEETARHAGHLDAARELLDGATGLGPR